METVPKLQDPRSTVWWHNFWLATALFFLVGTATFGGLFGWAFTEWKQDQSCHAYYAGLMHLPPDNRMPDTTIVHHGGQFYLRKDAEYDKSSCEGTLANQLITMGRTWEMPATEATSNQIPGKVLFTCTCHDSVSSHYDHWQCAMYCSMPGSQ